MAETEQSVLPVEASGTIAKNFELVLKNYETRKPEEITDALTLLLKKAYRLLVSEIYDKTIAIPNWVDTQRTVTYPVHVTFVDGMPHQISPAGYELPEREGSVQDRFFDVLEELSLLPILKGFSKDLVIPFFKAVFLSCATFLATPFSIKAIFFLGIPSKSKGMPADGPSMALS